MACTLRRPHDSLRGETWLASHGRADVTHYPGLVDCVKRRHILRVRRLGTDRACPPLTDIRQFAPTATQRLRETVAVASCVLTLPVNAQPAISDVLQTLAFSLLCSVVSAIHCFFYGEPLFIGDAEDGIHKKAKRTRWAQT